MGKASLPQKTWPSTTKVGTLGPYRGRLGLAWVIAPLVAGVVILVAGYLALYR